MIGLTKSALKKTLGATLESLQTIVIEVEALLNDRPLNYVSSDVSDLEPITPSHPLQGRRITTLPYSKVEDDEITDPDFGDDSQSRHSAKTQAIIVKHFWSRWRHEYLTALRETHRKIGNNVQQVKVGDVVLVHDNTARVNWKLAVIKSLNKGGDGMIRSANIRTTTGRTNRPIAHLYPLEVTAPEMTVKPSNTEVSEDRGINQPTIPPRRPVREAARVGQERMKEWISSLRGPPEDVTDSD